MFCPNCGNQLKGEGAFCPKCGTKISAASSIPVQTAVVNSEKPVKQKKGKRGIIITVIVIILLLVLLTRCSGSTNDGGSLGTSERGSQTAGSNQGIIESGSGSANIGEVYEDGSLNFEVIISQCKDCEAPLNTLVEFCDLGSAYGYDEDKINACSTKKYNEMHHNCTADVIQVENIPYVYRGYYGTYSGDWQGAGPTGTGTFVGEHRLTTHLISYTGDWKYGLPEGEGELCIIKSLNYSGNDIQYVGQMSAGLRHGTGYMYEYAAGPSGFYRIYDESVFQDDIMSVETQAASYDLNTGEVIFYGKYIGIENGEIGATALWSADELSPDEKKIVNYVVLGALAYMGYKAADSLLNANAGAEEYYDRLNQEMFDDLEKSRAQEQADLLERQEREAREAEKTRQWNEDKYYESLNNDPNGSNWQTKAYKYNAGLGW